MSNASDFIIKNGVLTKYLGAGGSVLIPDGVTTIGDGVFYRCTNLIQVNIPDSVTAIGDSAFYNCQSLSIATIPDSVTAIGNLAFAGCTNLSGVTIPDGVMTIGERAYIGCCGLADDQGFITVKKVLYGYCGNESEVMIPGGVTVIGNWAFSDCKQLTRVIIPNSVIAIGDSAFSGCESLTDMSIPDSVTIIDDYAFADCKSLTTLYIPDSVTSVGAEAFAGCRSLINVTLPTHLGALASKYFAYRADLRITIADLSVLPAKFRICAALCFAEDGGQNTDPRFVSHGKYLKANAGKLARIAAGNPALLNLLCQEKWIKVKDVDAYMAAVQQGGNAESIAMILDYQANSLTDKEKEEAAKQKEAQENTVFERAVARMDLVGISGLNFVVTGALETFADRKELKSFIEKKGGKLQPSISAKTDYLIMNGRASAGEKKKIADELGIEVITEYQFNEKADRHFEIDNKGKLIKYRGAGGDVTIPDNFKDIHGYTRYVRAIGRSAFSDCKRLSSVTIPNSVTYIDRWAFSGCENLTNVIILNNVAAICKSAFSCCRSLASVTIPDSVTEIDRSAFESCGKFRIIGNPGSYAETYAKENNIPFVAE